MNRTAARFTSLKGPSSRSKVLFTDLNAPLRSLMALLRMLSPVLKGVKTALKSADTPCGTKPTSLNTSMNAENPAGALPAAIGVKPSFRKLAANHPYHPCCQALPTHSDADRSRRNVMGDKPAWDRSIGGTVNGIASPLKWYHRTATLPVCGIAWAAAVLAAVVMAPGTARGDEQIVVHSGNGPLGGSDSVIRFRAGSGPFLEAHFTQARAGEAAAVVARHVGADAPRTWLASLMSDPDARWVAINAQRAFGDALYAHDFMITSPDVCNATIDLWYAVDDKLGETGIPGVYLNGDAVPNAPQRDGGFTGQQLFTSGSVGGLLRPGLNTLYLFQNDTAMAVAGIIFSARITIESGPRITAQPSGRLTCPAGMTAFAITAAGEGPITYRWEWQPVSPAGLWTAVLNGSNEGTGVGFVATGAHSDRLSISAVTGAPFSILALPFLRFRSVPSNPCGDTASAEGVLTICPADFDCSNAISVQDLFDFLGLWFAGDSPADFNRTDGVSVQDIFDFLAAYFAGCA